MTPNKGRPEKFGCREKKCGDLSYYVKDQVSIRRYCERAGRPIARMRICPLEVPAFVPKDAQKAVLNAMYHDEWLPVGIIAMGCGKNHFATNHYLIQLLKEGLVERRYDSELGRMWGKLPGGEAFHRASEEVKSG